MKIQKKKVFYLLDEVASMYQCSRDDLIHFGAEGLVPIYVLADGWWVEIFGRYLTELDESCDNEADDYSRQLPRFPKVISNVGETFRQPVKHNLIGPVRLHASTLEKYQINPQITEHSFYCEGPDDDTPVVFEYRLCTSPEGRKREEIDLATSSLVVLTEDLQIIEHLVPIQEAIPPQDVTPASTKKGETGGGLRTAQKQIAMLCWLLYENASAYQHGSKPNGENIYKALEQRLDAYEYEEEDKDGNAMLKKKKEKRSDVDINRNGLGSSTLRGNLFEGLKLIDRA